GRHTSLSRDWRSDVCSSDLLQRTGDRPVHHDRLLLLRIRADVEGAETFRQVEVDLRRAALLLAADRILQRVLELRAVERTLAFRSEERRVGKDCGSRCARAP